MSSEFAKDHHLDVLLRELPYVEEPVSTEQICVSGILARSEPGVVRLVMGGYCLTFDSADVEDVLKVSAEDEDNLTPQTVRLLLRRPAQLLNVEPWTEFDQATSGATRPFAFAARPHPIVAPPNSEFRSRERSFLRDFEK
jgi:hypothetical protein